MGFPSYSLVGYVQGTSRCDSEIDFALFMLKQFIFWYELRACPGLLEPAKLQGNEWVREVLGCLGQDTMSGRNLRHIVGIPCKEQYVARILTVNDW